LPYFGVIFIKNCAYLLVIILTEKDILKEVKAKRLKISPFLQRNLGPGSYDLTLDKEFRFFKKRNKALVVDEAVDYKQVTTRVVAEKGIIIQPGELVLGITKERISLPDDVCGWLQGRTRFARLGLMIHITASYLQPGIDNRQVLEMFNASPDPMLVKPGTKVCQIIFERCEGKAKYSGKFKSQKL